MFTLRVFSILKEFNLRSHNIKASYAPTNRCRQVVLVQGTLFWNSLPVYIKLIQDKLNDYLLLSYNQIIKFYHILI